MSTLLDLDLKIKALRKEWVERPGKRPIIERQARAIEIAREIMLKKRPQQNML